MAAIVGSVGPFNSELQSWEEYCEILDYFFIANDIEEAEKKRAVLLSCVGAQTYALMRNLLSPAKPKDRSYVELVELLNNHFHPKPNEIVQRWKFNTRNRKPEERVCDYAAELRKLAHGCNFGDSLTAMLRDRLVCGINDDRIQRRLLAEDGLTFEKALKFAQAMEAVDKDVVEDLRHLVERSRFSTGTGSVNKTEHVSSKSQQYAKKCSRCGGANHLAKDCWFLTQKCHNCGKVGHAKRVCRFKEEQKGGRGRPGRRAHFLEEEEMENEEEVAEMHDIKVNMESPQESSEVLQLLEDYCTRRSRWRSAGPSQWRTLRGSRIIEPQGSSSLPDVPPPRHFMQKTKVPAQHGVTERLVELTESAPIRKDEVQTQEEIIQKLVQFVIMFGDDINAKLEWNSVLKEQLKNLNYKTFEKLTSTVQNLVPLAGQAAGPDCRVVQQKIAWAFEVTSRLSAVAVVHHRRVLNFGAQYIEKNHADWVRQRGGWDEAFDID